MSDSDLAEPNFSPAAEMEDPHQEEENPQLEPAAYGNGEDQSNVDLSSQKTKFELNTQFDEFESGSMDNLDTIALTTSPTMESLDLGDNKSIDSFRLDQGQDAAEDEDDDGGIQIKIGSDTATSDNDGADTEPKTEIEIPVYQHQVDQESAVEKLEDMSMPVSELECETTDEEPQPQTIDFEAKEAPTCISDYFNTSGAENAAFFDTITDATADGISENIPLHQTEVSPHVTESAPVVTEQVTGEILRQKHRSGSTHVETPACSFEGEKTLDSKVGSVSDLLMETTQDTEKSTKEEFFESFTAEGPQPQDDNYSVTSSTSKDKIVKKPSGPYVMPHLSPGPSPNTSAYASPIHTQVVGPPTAFSHPSDIPLATSPRSAAAFSEDIAGTSPFGAAMLSQDLEDPFSASLKMSEADRRKDAWIPSDVTRQTLVSMVTNAPGTFYPRQDQLTMPGLLLDERQGDPVVELMYKCMSEHEVMKRQTLSADMVSQDEEGIRKLIKSECYRSALDLSSKLLTIHGQGMGKMNLDSKNSPDTLQLWFVRIAMLLKLKLYQVAESELVPFSNFDKPDMYFEFYPELHAGRKGSMVPFALRILHAELPHFLGRSQDSLDRLYYIYAIVRKILSNLESGLSEDGSMLELADENRAASRDLWEKREIRVMYSIVTVLVGAKVYDSAVELLETLATKDPDSELTILSGLGRLYMQMGDVHSAQVQFDKLEAMTEEDDPLAQSKIQMNRGFVALGQNDFETAKQCFQMVVELDPGNGVAVNNMAVCCLYTGRLKEALHVLEALVQSNPARYLQDGILINLCTLYELESSRALQKKQQLLQLVAEYKGNGFNVSCLKMGELMQKK